jgi:hypothetical protein
MSSSFQCAENEGPELGACGRPNVQVLKMIQNCILPSSLTESGKSAVKRVMGASGLNQAGDNICEMTTVNCKHLSAKSIMHEKQMALMNHPSPQ